MEPVHATLEFTASIPAPVSTVWQAFADPAARVVWGAPAGEAQVYDRTDFRIGGRDEYRCGPPETLDFHGTTDYLAIVPERLLSQTDVVSSNGSVLAGALLTFRLEDDEDGTRIHLTDQVTSFVGQGMIEGHRNGHTIALQQLGDWVRSQSDSAADG